MKLSVDDMRLSDISQVVEVDRDSYPVPWPASAYRRELNNHRHARYLVLHEIVDVAPDEPAAAKRTWRDVLGWPRPTDPSEIRPVLGYAGMWLVADEAHVTTIAVRTGHRGKGLGELLLASLVERGMDVGIRWVTLEVRVSNVVAQRLYRKYGFRDAGLRKQYYSDNNEDALIMTTDDITLNAYRAQLESLVGALRTRFELGGMSHIQATALSFTSLPRTVEASAE